MKGHGLIGQFCEPYLYLLHVTLYYSLSLFINDSNSIMGSPVKRKVRQKNDEDGAPEDKATRKNPQEKIENDPLKGGGTSEIVWVHRNLKDDDVTHLSISPPLTASVSQVLHEVRNEQFQRWPTQMKSDPATRDNTKYYEFYRDYGHRTDKCIQLKREIEYLIQRGYLRRFISQGNQAQNQAQNQNQAPTQQPPPRQTTTQH